MDRPLSVTIRGKAVEQYFNVVLFVFQFYLFCHLSVLDFGTVRSERVKGKLLFKKKLETAQCPS